MGSEPPSSDQARLSVRIELRSSGQDSTFLLSKAMEEPERLSTVDVAAVGRNCTGNGGSVFCQFVVQDWSLLLR